MPSFRANLPWSIYVLLGTVFYGIVMSIIFSNGLAYTKLSRIHKQKGSQMVSSKWFNAQ